RADLDGARAPGALACAARGAAAGGAVARGLSGQGPVAGMVALAVAGLAYLGVLVATRELGAADRALVRRLASGFRGR
ncbi:MAG: hypothetical protein ACK6CU_10780, partial [Deltaproteobacteria bacterium]